MEPRRAIEVIADACQALNFSHQHGIIHRDVKPANIMISNAGAVKVMDFGIARALADASNVTQTAAVIGTAQYLSPEQARGEKVDARSDVYSLGCVLYEMLTGEPPFVGDSPVAVAYQHVREDPIPPSQRHEGISPELDAVVLKALAKNPDNRYQTAAEMRTDLVKVHSGEQPDAPKVFTDAERSSLMSAQPGDHQTEPIGAVGRAQPQYIERERRGSVGRWLIAVAVLAVLTVVVTLAINMVGGGTRDVAVPDVSGKVSADAIAELQNRGFRTRTQQKPDSNVPPDHVIGTDPSASSSVDAGDEITISVSTGPEQREIPDVRNLSYDNAVEKLTDAGFENFRPSSSPSTPEMKDKVLGTNPPVNQTSAITNEITDRAWRRPGNSPDSRREGAGARQRRADSDGVGLHQGRAGGGRQHTPRRAATRYQSACGTDGSDRHGDSAASIAGQPVRDARPPGPVLDRCRAEASRTGLDWRTRPWRRRSEQRPADQRRSDPEPGCGHRSELRRPDHAEFRVVAAATAVATSSSSRRTSVSSGAAPQ